MPRDVQTMMALDKMLSEIYGQNTMAAVNKAANTNHKAYKKHNLIEINRLIIESSNDPTVKLGEKVHAKHELLYSKIPEKYIKAAGKIGGDDQLGRLWSYALNPTVGKNPIEKKKIEDENLATLKRLQDKGEQKKFLEEMKNKMLDADYTKLLTGNVEDALEFADENMQLCECGWAIDDFKAKLTQYGVEFDAEEKKQFEEKQDEIKAMMSPIAFAEFMSSDIYPLLKDRGLDKMPGMLGNQVVSPIAPDKNQNILMNYQVSENRSEAVAGKEFFDVMKSFSSHIDLFYTDAANRILAGKIEDALEDTGWVDELSVRDEEGKFADPIEIMIQNACFKEDGEEIPATTSKKKLISKIIAGDSRITMERKMLDDGTMPKPWDLKVENGEFKFCSRAADSVKDRLTELKNELESSGTTIGTSPEYQKMLKAIELVTEPDVMGECRSVEDMQEAMQNLVTAADNYYYAKLDQDKNETRSARFDIAREIVQMSEDLKENRVHKNPSELTPKEQEAMLKRDVIRKYEKTFKEFQITNDKSLTNDQKKAKIKALKSPEARAKNYKATDLMMQAMASPENADANIALNTKKTLEKLLEGKNINGLQNLLNASRQNFILEVADAVKARKNAAVNEQNAPQRSQSQPELNNPVRKDSNPVIGG